MTSFAITGYSTSAQTLVGFESGLIGKDGILNTSSGSAITVTNGGSQIVQLNIQGIIDASGNSSSGKIVDFAGAELTVLVGETASLSGLGTGARGFELDLDERVAVTNHGAIHADGNTFYVTHVDTTSDFDLFNTGQITSMSTAIQFVSAIDDDVIFNSGLISAATSGISYSSSSASATLQLTNSGTIHGGNHAINLSLMSGYVTILNSGNLIGTDGIENSSLLAGLNNTILRNSGLIQSTDDAYNGSIGLDTIFNTGLMVGDINLRGGNDFYLGRQGSVDGGLFGGDGNDYIAGGNSANQIDGGDGNDTLFGMDGDDLLSAGNGDDIVFGGAGNDSGDGGIGNDMIRGGDGADDFFGGSGNDMMYGGADDDIMDGELGDDVLRMGSGDDSAEGRGGKDTLFGGAGNDTLGGGTSADKLFGGDGDDTIDGGTGADLINGGRGDDELTGGNLADTFVFHRDAGFDTITDFENGVDKIDLRDFGIPIPSYNTVVAPALSDAGGGSTLLDLSAIGGVGSVLIEGLAFANADASDFLL